MKKRLVSPLFESLADDINIQEDYLEDDLSLMFEHVLNASVGIIYGLDITQINSTSIEVSSGAILSTNFKFGELEGTSGLVINLPIDANPHVHTVVAQYQEFNDTESSGYVLIDVSTRTETIETVARRKFGGITLSIAYDTDQSNVGAGYVPLAELNVTSGGIQAIETSGRVVSTMETSVTSAVRLDGYEGKRYNNVNLGTSSLGEVYLTTDPATGQLPAAGLTERLEMFAVGSLTQMIDVDADFVVLSNNKKISKIIIACPITPSSGTIEVDILKMNSPGGSLTSLYTTNSKPTIACNGGYTWAVFESPNLPNIIDVTKHSILGFRITDAPSGAKDMKVVVI